VVFRNDKGADNFYVTGRSLFYTISMPGAIEVISNTGQVIKKQSLYKGSGTISLDYLPAGIYYFRIDGVGIKSISIL
jgi:hypothetical protein